MQQIDFSYSKQMLTDIQQDRNCTMELSRVIEIVYTIILALERMQKEAA